MEYIAINKQNRVTKYIIETDQIALRELTMADFDAWHQILSDKETMQYYPSEFDEEHTRKWINWNLDNYNKYGNIMHMIGLPSEQFLQSVFGVQIVIY